MIQRYARPVTMKATKSASISWAILQDEEAEEVEDLFTAAALQ